MKEKRIPVILDTDIGGDIDDFWALALLLRCPELDTKLVVTALEGGDDPAGCLVNCAVYWKYKDVFYKFITDRLCRL